jgi:predicted RNA binding protein YcfA (HicA-like mRNA interferase family)
MHSRDVRERLRDDGWYEVNQVGSHKQFKHPTKDGRVTVPHPNRDIPVGTLKSIEKQRESSSDVAEPSRLKKNGHGIYRLSSQGARV